MLDSMIDAELPVQPAKQKQTLRIDLAPEYQGHHPLRLPKRSVLTTRAHCAAGLITAQALVRERRGAQWRKRLRSAALPGRTARPHCAASHCPTTLRGVALPGHADRRTARPHCAVPHAPAALPGHAHRPTRTRQMTLRERLRQPAR